MSPTDQGEHEARTILGSEPTLLTEYGIAYLTGRSASAVKRAVNAGKVALFASLDFGTVYKLVSLEAVVDYWYWQGNRNAQPWSVWVARLTKMRSHPVELGIDGTTYQVLHPFPPVRVERRKDVSP